MTDLSDFINKNVKAELIKDGHSSAVANTCADSAKAEYKRGSNWRTGSVYKELMKQARKNAGKVKKVKK